jgi:hypothetical protein
LALYPSYARVSRQWRLGLASLAAVAAVIAGCGGGSSSSTTTETRSGPKETAQKLPKLPPGWKDHRDSTIGYAIGLPPGWKVSGKRRTALFRPPDHLVAMTLTASRDPGAFEIPVDKFAEQALGGLPGFKVPLNPGKVTRFKGTPLKAVRTSASGSQAGGIRENATLVVLRRDHLVNYTVAVLQNTEQPGASLDRAVALRMVQTLRDEPPKGESRPSSG